MSQSLYHAAINCGHEIDSDRVVLHFDDRQPGHNPLSQLRMRLDAELGSRCDAAVQMMSATMDLLASEPAPVRVAADRINAAAQAAIALIRSGGGQVSPAPKAAERLPLSQLHAARRIVDAVEAYLRDAHCGHVREGLIGEHAVTGGHPGRLAGEVEGEAHAGVVATGIRFEALAQVGIRDGAGRGIGPEAGTEADIDGDPILARERDVTDR